MVTRVMANTLTPLTPYAVLMDTRCLRAPSHNWKKLSALFTSANHHWISGVGFPTTSQYSSNVSPVSLVSERGDFTNPAEGRHRETWQIKTWEEKIGQWEGSGWTKRKHKRLNSNHKPKMKQEINNCTADEWENLKSFLSHYMHLHVVHWSILFLILFICLIPYWFC